MNVRAFAAVLLLLAVPCWAASDVEKAQTERAIGLIEVLGTENVEQALSYVRQNLTPEKVASRSDEDWKRILSRLTEDMRTSEVAGVEIDGEAHVNVHVETPRGTLTFGFDFETVPPHRIAGLAVDMRAEGGEGPRGPDLSSPRLQAGMSEQEVVDELQRYFGELAEEDVFSGTALVAKKGTALFTTAQGYASHRFRVPNKLDTRFDLGSINKDFTKIAIGQLLATRRLELDDTVAERLPGYPNPAVAEKVTIGHLIEHTSGLGDIFNDEFFDSSKARYRSPGDYFPLFAHDELLFEPGASRRYSNGGYMVLGAIIESVSGRSYDEYVTRNIFEPAGMNDSGFFAHDEPVPNVAIGYTRRGRDNPSGELRNNLLMLPVKGSPAGSAYSTVEDLLRFDNAVREHELLPPAYTNWLFGGALPDPGQPSNVSSERLEVAAGLAGGAPGVSATLEIDGDLVVIILSNYDAPIAESIAAKLRRPLRQALGR